MMLPPDESGVRFPTLLSPEVAADPQVLYRELRRLAPVHFDESVDAYLLARHADVLAAYKNPTFSTRNYEWQLEPVHGRTVLQMDGREHAQRKSLIMPHLRGHGLDQWIPVIMRHTARLIDAIVERAVNSLTSSWSPDERIDLVQDFSNYLPASVIAEMLGLPADDHERFHSWYTSIVAFLSNLAQDPAIIEQGERTRAELREYMLPLIERRRQEPGDDMISVLCQEEIDGERMSDEDIKSYISLLLTAGAETTDKAFSSLFKNLLEHRDQFEAVRDDRSLLLAAITETLRFSPPSQMNGRYLLEDIEVEGVTMPAGSNVMLLIASANRDERRFERPDEFNIHRSELQPDRAFTAASTHLSFGSGRHFCAGALVAKTELEIAANAVMDRFPNMRVVPGFVAREIGVKLRAPDSLQVELGA